MIRPMCIKDYTYPLVFINQAAASRSPKMFENQCSRLLMFLNKTTFCSNKDLAASYQIEVPLTWEWLIQGLMRFLKILPLS